MQTLAAAVTEWVVIAFIAGLGIVLLYLIFVGRIDLSTVLNEIPSQPAPANGPAAAPGAAPVAAPPPAVAPAGAPPAAADDTGSQKASLSRLQMLIFTFVIAGLYLTLCLEAGTFLEIPNQVLGLLGISGGSYVLSKGIQANM